MVITDVLQICSVLMSGLMMFILNGIREDIRSVREDLREIRQEQRDHIADHSMHCKHMHELKAA